MQLYLLGGRQKKRWLHGPEETKRFDLALVLRLDTDKETIDSVIEYRTPADAKADGDSSNLFASGTLVGNQLYLCTYTEVLVFELPQFTRVAYISLPCFNSLHHVCPTPKGTLLVANTGLDMVLEITRDGTVLQEWSVLGGSPWSRFSRNIDYRRVASTKPHLSHPNFVFQIHDDVWVTRFRQRDAICLTRPSQWISIDIERPHDGLLHEGLIYFTTVDGHLVTVDALSRKIVSTHNLKQMLAYPFAGPVWCRGVLVVNKGLVCVGFTRIRKSMLLHYANWIKHGLRHVDPPTHIAVFNLRERRCVKTINLEPFGVNILFGVLNAELETSERR